jgi:hypothetical protein
VARLARGPLVHRRPPALPEAREEQPDPRVDSHGPGLRAVVLAIRHVAPPVFLRIGY